MRRGGALDRYAQSRGVFSGCGAPVSGLPVPAWDRFHKLETRFPARLALRSGGGLACLYWLAIPVHDFGGLPWALAAPCPLLMGAYIGLYGGLFAALAHA